MDKSLSSNPNSNRWIALDYFRGLTIAGMIIVNNPGDWGNLYSQLAHAEWHGLTLTDLVFPFFLFIVGVSVAIAFSKQLEKGNSLKSIYSKTIIRSLKLFGLGLFLGLLFYDESKGFRIAGVLQRIAIVYLISSIIFLNSKWKTQVAITVTILISYWLMLSYIPVPELGYPSVEPVNNLVSWFDRKYLPGMLYLGYHDPEGLLSTIPSIATGLLGVLTGQLALRVKDKSRLIKQLIFVGISILSVGYLWQLNFPLNKNLWTSSFVMVTAGYGILVLAFATWIIDIKNINFSVKPFIVFGSNAIASYMLSFIFLFAFIYPVLGMDSSIKNTAYTSMVELGISPNLSSFIWALAYTTLCYIPVLIMYKKKIFLKV